MAPQQPGGAGGFLPNVLSLAEAATKVEGARARATTDDRALQTGGHGTDPDYVASADRFQGYSADQIVAAVHGSGGLDPAGILGHAKTWREVYSGLVNLGSFNLIGMNRIFNSGQWQGATADAGQAATERFAKLVQEVGLVCESVFNRIEAVGWAAETVKVAIQQSPAVTTGAIDPDNPTQSILPGLSNPETDEKNRNAEKERRDAMIRALDSMYTPVFPPSGAGVPAFLEVAAAGGPGGQPAGPGANGDGGGSGVPNAGQKPASTPEQPTALTGTPADTNAPKNTDTKQDSTPSDAPATTPAETTPASTQPGATTPGSSPAVPGGQSSAPGGGSPGGSPGLGGTIGAPTAGRAIPGGAGAPGATPVGATSSGGRGAADGRSMMPGMPGAAGRGANRDDESEHYAPDYLRGVHPDWTDGIVAYSGVIGGEADSATTPASAETLPAREQAAGPIPSSQLNLPPQGVAAQPPPSESFNPRPTDSSAQSPASAGAAGPRLNMGTDSPPRLGTTGEPARTEPPIPVHAATVSDDPALSDQPQPEAERQPNASETRSAPVELAVSLTGAGPVMADDTQPPVPRP
ncbi:hypothetical protein [Nocardia camponoti]|uniref:PPE domain-containing protein n=1 Tax=Nocardia camponoti TaxID=1616106 RepID=A0A917V504_9NOCA|nr:hypothetical protein [Nocardia camponoti]GGK40660.1 hypothetical protein GCM10011591_10320 [Nocardia camponoti]